MGETQTLPAMGLPSEVVDKILEEDARELAAERRAEKAQQKKEEQPMSKPQAVAKVPTVTEFPQAEWEELCQRFEGTPEQVRVEVRRQTPRGTWATIRTLTMPPRKIVDIGPVLTALAGGGTFVFEVQDLRTKQRLIASRWSETFDAAVRQPTDGVTILYDADNDSLVLGPQHVDTFAGWQMPAASTPVMPFAPAAPGYAPHPIAGASHALPPFPQPQHDPRGNLLPPPDDALPGSWARGYNVHQQWDIAKRTYRDKHGADPDQALGVSMQWVTSQQRETADARVKGERLEERLAAMQQQFSNLLDAEREAKKRLEIEVEKMRAKRENDELRVQIATLATKLDSLATGYTAPRQEKPALDIVALAGALGPLAVAWITASGERERAAADRQTQMLTTMLAGQKSNIPELLATVAPAVTPILVQWMSNQSPEKLAELRTSQDESRMMLLKMMHDMVQASTPRDEPEPWWKPVLLSILNELGGAAKAAALSSAMNRALPPPQQFHPAQQFQPPPAHAMPPPREPAPAPATTQAPAAPSPVEQAAAEDAIVTPAPVRAPGDLDALLQALAQSDLEAAQKTALLVQTLVQGIQMGDPRADARFLTHEWVVILFNMHAKLAPDELVPMVVAHIEHSSMFKMLPAVLEPVFEKPHEAIQQLIGSLPTLDTTYATTIAQAIADEISEREAERDEEDEGDEEEAADAAE